LGKQELQAFSGKQESSRFVSIYQTMHTSALCIIAASIIFREKLKKPRDRQDRGIFTTLET